MDKAQVLKMQLLKEFGIIDEKKSVDFCREAYKFLTEGEQNDKPSAAPAVSSEEAIAVDMGLPSGTLWCDRNVGAKFPEDYGAFFSWGNTDPHYPNRDNMDWGDDDDGFDYSFDSDTYEKTAGYKLESNIDYKIESNIDMAHDAARVNMGEPWQMPTEEQIKELFDNCDWVRKTINGINGYIVTSKINGNVIFFPASGYGLGTSWYNRGSYGYYWSSSWNSALNARYLNFNSGGVYPQINYNRYNGFPVRPVQLSHQK